MSCAPIYYASLSKGASLTIRDLSVDGQNLPTSAAFCIIGGGIVGLLLATRLARRRHNVVVLESGGLGFEDEVHALNTLDDSQGHYKRELTGRYRGLGGSSSRWGGRMIPISPREMEARDYLSQAPWPLPASRLDKYQSELEDLFRIGHDSFETIDAATPGASNLLISDTEYLRARWAKCPTFKRCNIVTALGREIRDSPYLTVVLHATVVDFSLDRERGRLTAITAKSLTQRTLTIKADEFTIAAGSIESTRLLLLLDAASNDQAFARTNALGRYFQDHLKAEVATVDRRRPQLTNHLFGYRFVKGSLRDPHLVLSHEAQQRERVGSGFVYVSMGLANSGLQIIKSIAHGVQ